MFLCQNKCRKIKMLRVHDESAKMYINFVAFYMQFCRNQVLLIFRLKVHFWMARICRYIKNANLQSLSKRNHQYYLSLIWFLSNCFVGMQTVQNSSSRFYLINRFSNFIQWFDCLNKVSLGFWMHSWAFCLKRCVLGVVLQLLNYLQYFTNTPITIKPKKRKKHS